MVFQNGLDTSAVWRATLSVSVFILPIGILQNWLLDSSRIDSNSVSNYLLFAAILACGVLGGFAGAMLAPKSPIVNGAAAAAAAYVLIQTAGTIRRLVVGESVSSPLGWAYLMLLMASMGMIGAALERKTRPYRITRK